MVVQLVHQCRAPSPRLAVFPTRTTAVGARPGRAPTARLKRAGGTLADVVTMTVFIRNQSDGDEFVKIRGEVFKSGFPASALITAKDFAIPQILVEIQSVAVIGERN